VHLGGDDGAGEDTATDGDFASEGALLICRIGKSAMLAGVIFFKLVVTVRFVLCSIVDGG